MNKLLVFLPIFTIFLWNNLAAQNIDFVNPNLKNDIIDLGIDTNGDGEISFVEAEALEKLEIYSNHYSDVSDVNHFPNLKHLNVADNPINQSMLYKIDLEKLSKLEYLNVSGGQFDSLNFLQNHGLDTLIAAAWKFHTMDLSGLDSLVVLDCSSVELDNIDLKYLTKLKYLRCSFTKIDDFSNALPDQLENFVCGGCNITSLGDNFPIGIKTLFIKEADLGDVDLRPFKDLVDVRVVENNITSLNVEGLYKLTLLTAWDNNIPELNITGMDSLRTLQVSNNLLTELDLKGKPNLTSLIISNNNLTTLDVSENPNLEVLICRDNPISSLDASYSDKLRHLFLSYCPLVDLNMKNNAFEVNLRLDSIPTLEYICADGFQYNQVDSLVQLHGYDTQIDTVCAPSLVELSSLDQIIVMPNPVSDLLIVSNISDYDRIKIYNANGILFHNLRLYKSLEEIHIDVHDLESGVYYCLMTNGSMTTTKKFIKID